MVMNINQNFILKNIWILSLILGGVETNKKLFDIIGIFILLISSVCRCTEDEEDKDYI